jgi:ribA/ribD-fused uncharacterized protein
MSQESKKRDRSDSGSPESSHGQKNFSKSAKVTTSPEGHIGTIINEPHLCDPKPLNSTIMADSVDTVNVDTPVENPESIQWLVNAFKNFEIKVNKDLTKLDKIDELVVKTSNLTTDVCKLQQSHDMQNAKICELKSELLDCKQKVLELESHSKKKNLLIEGITEEQSKIETEDQLKTKVGKIMSDAGITDWEDIPIEAIHRLGKPNSKPRTVIVRFVTQTDKLKVWAIRFALKGTDYWMKEHLPSEIEYDRKILKPYFNAALSEKMKPKYVMNRIKIGSRLYGVSDISELPVNIGVKKLFLDNPKYEGITIVSGISNPLSNVFPSELQIEDRTFTCVNQFVEFRKAEISKDINVVQAVLKARTSNELYNSTKHLKDSADWSAIREVVMNVALHCKFKQCSIAAKTLLATGDNTLVYQDSDVIWGTGKISTVEGENIQWPGQNLVGKLLMKVRDELNVLESY